MPGVPKSRGCDACRKNKKKCVGTTAPCERCKRLNLDCIGFGMQRWKFMHEAEKPADTTKTPTPTTTTTIAKSKAIVSQAPPIDIGILESPGAKLARISIGLINTPDFFEQSFFDAGGFLPEVPRRLGTHPALDAAVNALVTAFVLSPGPRSKQSPEALQQYGKSLMSIRESLAGETVTDVAEVLSAMKIIMIYETYLGSNSGFFHCAGAAHIVKLRGIKKPRDALEAKIMETQRVSLISDALLTDNMHFSTSEWFDLIINQIDTKTLDGRVVRLNAELAPLMKLGRQAMQRDVVPTEVLDGLKIEAHALRQRAQSVVREVQEAMSGDNVLNALFVSDMSDNAYDNPYHVRLYAAALKSGISIDLVNQGLGGLTEDLNQELAYYALEVVELARQRERAFRSHVLLPALSAAFIATDDASVRARVMGALFSIRSKYPELDAPPLCVSFEWLRNRFLLKQCNAMELGRGFKVCPEVENYLNYTEMEGESIELLRH